MRELVAYRGLLRALVARDLKVRYKRSVLGVLWTMLNPLFLMGIMAFVFSHILRVTVERIETTESWTPERRAAEIAVALSGSTRSS